MIAEVRLAGEVQIVLKKDKARTVLFGLFLISNFNLQFLEKPWGLGQSPDTNKLTFF